jgi:hypothetical protein
MSNFFRALLLLTVIALVLIPAPAAKLAGAEKTVDPCSLLTVAEIQEALGKPVQAGKRNAGVNPELGFNCNYIVGDFGSFNILLKPMYAGETPERIKAQFVRMKMNPVDLPNVGDHSFFTSPGFGMTQLQTFKGSKYILFTLLVPGAKEPAQQAAAAKLMRMLLSRL